MVSAFYLFHSWNKNKGYINSRAYETNREEWRILNGKIHKGQMSQTKGKSLPTETKNKISNSVKEYIKTYGSNAKYVKDHGFSMFGKCHSKETKSLMSEKASGENNQAYGKHWWNNGIEQIFCKDNPGEGWINGRIRKMP